MILFFKKILKLAFICYLFFTFLPASFPSEKLPVWKNTFQKKILANGLTIIHQRDESSLITVLQIIIKGGKRAVPEGKEGLAYLTTRLSIEIPDISKIQKLMKQASNISMSCRGDYSFINLKCLSNNLEESLKVITKIIQDPLFSGLRINNIKKYMIYRSKKSEDDPIFMEDKIHLKSFFGKTGYGSSAFGSKESLKSIKKKDIENFYKKNFLANNMIVSVSSDLEEEFLIETIRKFFTKFPQGKIEETKLKGAYEPKDKYIFLEKDTKQTLVSIGFPLPEITASNFILAFLIENLLGKGVNSKLWFLRSRDKLAYNVNSQATQMKEGGFLKVYLETENKNKDRALEALKKVLQTVYEKGITEEKLEETKIISKANFLRINETKEERISNLAYFEVTGLGYEFLNQFFEEIDKTSLEEINTYIKDILNPDKGVEVIIGQKSSVHPNDILIYLFSANFLYASYLSLASSAACLKSFFAISGYCWDKVR